MNFEGGDTIQYLLVPLCLNDSLSFPYRPFMDEQCGLLSKSPTWCISSQELNLPKDVTPGIYPYLSYVLNFPFSARWVPSAYIIL